MKKYYLSIIFLLIIQSLAFTQTNTDKLATKRQKINKLLDDWHLAAAKSDGDAFFGKMDKEAIYLGTDASERWKRDELRTWSKKYFERESAWDFKPYERQIYFTDKGKYAWFEEKLDTWMGVCRGSGVLKFHKKKGWKIYHYNLAVTVPNDNIQEFLKIATQK